MSHIELSSIQFEFCSFCSLHVTLMVCFKAVFLLIIIIPDLPTSHDSTVVLFCGWPKLMQILVKDFMEKSFCKSNYVLYSLSHHLKICLSVCLNLSLSVCLSVCLSASYLFIVIFKVFSMIVKFLSVCYY